MSEHQDKRGGSGCAIGAVLMMLPILYVLSLGPAAWLFNRSYISIDFFLTAYHPIFWVAEKVGWVNKAVEWYAGFW